MANVLLVTGSPETGYRMRAALTAAGHTVFLEFHSRDALRAIESRDFDVLVCDAVLPAMFGTDLIVAARGIKQDSALPAVLLGGLPAPLEYELFDAQPVHIVPAAPEDLVQLLGQFNSKRPPRSDADEPNRQMVSPPVRRSDHSTAAR